EIPRSRTRRFRIGMWWFLTPRKIANRLLPASYGAGAPSFNHPNIRWPLRSGQTWTEMRVHCMLGMAVCGPGGEDGWYSTPHRRDRRRFTAALVDAPVLRRLARAALSGGALAAGAKGARGASRPLRPAAVSSLLASRLVFAVRCPSNEDVWRLPRT